MSAEVRAVVVSVLLPTKNRAQFVERAVRSILGQTLRDFECIVIDDGSTDDTVAKLEAIGDPRVLVLRQPVSAGIAAALNRGIAVARGRYWARMDSDDVSLPTRLAKQVAWLDAHPEVDICGTAARMVTESGRQTRRWPPGRTDEQIRAGLFFGNQLAHPTIMVRRGLAGFVYRPETVPAEDYDLWLRLSRGHRFVTLPDVLLDYCEHAGAESSLRRQEQQTRDEELRVNLIREIWPEAPEAAAAALSRWVRSGKIETVDEGAARELMAELVRRNGIVGRLPREEFQRQAGPFLPVVAEISGTQAERVGLLEFAVYVQAIRDDFCLHEVCTRVLEEQRPGREAVRALFLFCPDEYWSGRPTPESDRAAVAVVAEKLQRGWPNVAVKFVLQPVAPWRKGTTMRHEVETRLRNAAREHIRAEGFRHILVVDDDELWWRGALRRIATVVRKRKPATVWSRTVPVVGVPGLPVNSARDTAVVYLRADAYFVFVRWASAPRVGLRGRWFIHFTGTKRSRAALAEKMHESGHFDDPEHAYDNWMEEVLPRIAPGFAGADTIRKRRDWGAVRRWREAEWAEVPERFRPFLRAEFEAEFWWLRALRRAGFFR
jgi:hypothetical protein